MIYRRRLLTIAFLALCICGIRAQEMSVCSPRLQQLYELADKSNSGKMKKAPVIGITTTLKNNVLSVGYDYAKAVMMEGGIPLLIPSTDDPALIERITELIDGLLMTGGADVHPSYYGHEPHEKLEEVNNERDRFELLLFRKAYQRDIPIFGICRGMQIINIAMGGTLWQDIPSEFNSNINHRKKDDSTIPAHEISILPKSYAAKIFGTTRTGVNSRHHQCVKDVAPGLKITAWSNDQVPEILEGYPEKKIFAIQSHPEIFTVHHSDEVMPRFFKTFIKECKKQRKRK